MRDLVSKVFANILFFPAALCPKAGLPETMLLMLLGLMFWFAALWFGVGSLITWLLVR